MIIEDLQRHISIRKVYMQLMVAISHLYAIHLYRYQKPV